MDAIGYASGKFPGEQVDFIFDIQPGQMEAAEASWRLMGEIVRRLPNRPLATLAFKMTLMFCRCKPPT